MSEYLCTHIYSFVPSIFINSFFFEKSERAGEREREKSSNKLFGFFYVNLLPPSLVGLLESRVFFIHSFICTLVRSFVRLRVKINNFFCCCYFIRIYCAHFCNILWLLSYLSVLSAIYISNWYTFEIRRTHIHAGSWRLLLLLLEIFLTLLHVFTHAHRAHTTHAARTVCLHIKKSSRSNVWRAK